VTFWTLALLIKAVPLIIGAFRMKFFLGMGSGIFLTLEAFSLEDFYFKFSLDEKGNFL
jgi:hypothetical protein